ncbi:MULTISPECIES: TRAP transporter small permease [Halomonadaceae]|jgi:TRAP-type C4-dicarboxylate transport system permease small subunit|uniref:TRAP transporter small permease n=1 Tax=Halomonadaceae TaxID=28256 RepID=UPI0012EFCC7D|nr:MULTISPECIES: TRAP transporter small permease [Halomonas]CAD5269854.1 C4-dicarboxylate ABC transporter permease [Halomonas sp. I3]CAD5275746.1 C4-dicarboxylate ABC transporter permease [Halomonas sp. 113]CAD5276238.1 C4-dicarboxylate ABC transporter permease [Halomonas sp. 156]CAD5277473.1 C4-dicarboxylate ABC transporter permease [Halomonas sp. 59]VXC01524.1 C4-dicarboxylate ABC transporter permease [Halomonas titanicae]
MQGDKDTRQGEVTAMSVEPGRESAAGGESGLSHNTTTATPPLKWVCEDHVALGVMILLGSVVFAQFLSRYVFNHSIGWTEEGARMLLVLLVFIGAAGAASRGAHINVEILELIVPAKAKRWLRGFNNLISALFFVYVAWLAWQVGQRVWNSSMSTLPISKGWLYTVIAVACAAMALRMARQGIAYWRGKEEK